MKMFNIFNQISLKFVPNDSINNKSALVQVIVCCLYGAMSLAEPMITQFIDTYY